MVGTNWSACASVNSDACILPDPTWTISRRSLAAFLASDKGDGDFLVVAFCLDDADFFVYFVDEGFFLGADLDFVDFLPVELRMMI